MERLTKEQLEYVDDNLPGRLHDIALGLTMNFHLNYFEAKEMLSKEVEKGTYFVNPSTLKLNK